MVALNFMKSWKIISFFWSWMGTARFLFVAKLCRRRATHFAGGSKRYPNLFGHNHICSLQLPINVPFFSRPWGQWLPLLPPGATVGLFPLWRRNGRTVFVDFLKICKPQIDHSKLEDKTTVCWKETSFALCSEHMYVYIYICVKWVHNLLYSQNR